VAANELSVASDAKNPVPVERNVETDNDQREGGKQTVEADLRM
jgi:hypothetical protein